MTKLALAVLFAVAGCGDNGTAVDITVTSLDFGQTSCGDTAIPRVLTLTNNTTEPFTFVVERREGSFYTVVPPAGVVLPDAQVEVVVHSNPIPAISAITENLYGETLTVSTSAGDAVEVALTQSARGAILETSRSAFDFLEVRPLGAEPASIPVTITNTGNLPATIDVAMPGRSFRFVPAGEQPLAPGETLAANFNFTATATTTETETATVVTTGTLCSAVPEITASGTGTAAGLAAQIAIAPERGRPRTGGRSTICIRTTTGRVACSGSNTFGARGTTDARLARLSGFSFGGGGNGAVGFQQFGIFNLVETATGLLDNVVELAAGRGQFCARRQAGDVMCWGAIDGTGNQSAAPLVNPFARTVIAGGTEALAMAYNTRCTRSGTTMTCGFGAGGTGAAGSIEDITQIATSGGTAYGLTSGGTVISIGRNRNGERGFAGADFTPPAEIPNLTGVTAIVAGGSTSGGRGNRYACALLDDESVKCWGGNRHGTLGNNVSNDRDTDTPDPVAVLDVDLEPLANVQALAAGHNHTCAIVGSDGKSTPKVMCWGRGSEGEIGSGNFSQNVVVAEPTSPDLANAASLGAGAHGTCAILDSRAVRCWGSIGGQMMVGPTALPAFEP